QSRQRIAFAFYFIERIGRDIHDLAEVVQHGPALENIAAVLETPAVPFIFVKFIADIPDDLLEDILQRDDTARAAEFVHDDREMNALLLELLHEVADQLLLVDEIHRTKQGMPVEIVRLAQPGDQVPGMDHAGQFVEARLIDRKPGIVQLINLLPEAGKVQVVRHAADFQARAHDLLDRNRTELQQALEDIPFLVGRFVLCNLINLAAKLLRAQGRTGPTEGALQSLRTQDRPVSDAPEHEVDQLDDPGSIIGKLKIVLCRPDLRHDLAEKDHDEADQDHFDQEFEQPEILFQQDHFVDEKIREDDDGDIDNTIGNQHGSH